MKESERKHESALVKRLSKGDILAYNSLYRSYSIRLYHFAYSYLKSEVESEEIVQDVFMKIWQKRKELKPDLSFKSYVFTIAFNSLQKHFRDKARISKFIKTLIINQTDNETDNTVVFNSLLSHVNELVKQLPDRRREIFIKSRFRGISNSDIARELNISKKTVENQITDALSFIRNNMDDKLKIFLFLLLFFN